MKARDAFVGVLLMIVSFSNAQSVDDRAEIVKQIRRFSSLLMADNRTELLKLYTADARIMPNNTDILSGEGLANYWNPPAPSEWKTVFHKVTPLEIKVWGDEAYDFGYYEGISKKGEEESKWRGKYVIIWRKEEGVWKIYLDIWNRIAD